MFKECGKIYRMSEIQHQEKMNYTRRPRPRKGDMGKVNSQQKQNICITFIQCRPNVFDVGPTWYKCFANVLCLLGMSYIKHTFSAQLCSVSLEWDRDEQRFSVGPASSLCWVNESPFIKHVVSFEFKRCISHFTKWVMHPLNSKESNYLPAVHTVPASPSSVSVQYRHRIVQS